MLSVIESYSHAHRLFVMMHIHHQSGEFSLVKGFITIVVVNYSIANLNAFLEILSFNYCNNFPTNELAIYTELFMIVKILQVCDLKFSLTAQIHHTTSSRYLHSIALVSGQ